jgi:hypothetical protein
VASWIAFPTTKTQRPVEKNTLPVAPGRPRWKSPTPTAPGIDGTPKCLRPRRDRARVLGRNPDAHDAQARRRTVPQPARTRGQPLISTGEGGSRVQRGLDAVRDGARGTAPHHRFDRFTHHHRGRSLASPRGSDPTQHVAVGGSTATPTALPARSSTGRVARPGGHSYPSLCDGGGGHWWLFWQ